MSDFEIVSDELRNLPKRGGPDERIVALREGKTIFVPAGGTVPIESVSKRLSSWAVRYGYHSHTRQTEIDDVRGIVAWWTPKEASE